MKILKKIFDPEYFIPQPLIKARQNIGLRRAFKMVGAIGFSYIQLFFYLLMKRGIRAAYIFLWVKLFTPAVNTEYGISLQMLFVYLPLNLSLSLFSTPGGTNSRIEPPCCAISFTSFELKKE